MLMRDTLDPGPLRGSLPRDGLSREEAMALAVAVVAHVALIAALTLSPPGKDLQPPPQRMTVTFADEVADKSLSPQPDAQSAPDVAPDLGEPAPEPEALPQPEPPKPQPAPPPPAPKPQPAPPRPAPQPKPVPRPVPKPVAQPAPRPQATPAKPAPAKVQPAKPAAAHPADDRPRRRPDAPSGGSRIGSDFLAGIPGSTNPGPSHNPPADAAGPVPVASLVSGIARQIKPRWSAPQGVDSEKLVTVLAWNLNPDGTLAGRPVVVSQSGITDANRAQAARHAEQAIRAVQLAAPFQLPAQYYAQWKRVAQFRFDRKLSQ